MLGRIVQVLVLQFHELQMLKYVMASIMIVMEQWMKNWIKLFLVINEQECVI